MALPNAKILIHQVSSAFQGQATDIEIHAKEIIDVRQRLDEILAKHTGQDLEKVSKDTERDYFMSAEEAQAYNLIDRVISQALAASVAPAGSSSPSSRSARLLAGARARRTGLDLALSLHGPWTPAGLRTQWQALALSRPVVVVSTRRS